MSVVTLAMVVLLAGHSARAPAPHARSRARPTPTPSAAPSPSATPEAMASPASAAPGIASDASTGPTTRIAIEVEVVDVAGGLAFVKPGEQAGLVAGQSVSLNRADYKVLSVTEETAALSIGSAAIQPGMRGTAMVSPHRAAPSAAAGRPIASAPLVPLFAPAVPPARTQIPRHIPLSAKAARTSGPWNLAISARAASVNPSSSPDALTPAGAAYRGELEAIGNTQLGSDALHADADISVLGWGGSGLIPAPAPIPNKDDARPNAFVRELEMRWGDRFEPYTAAGRLRRAAWTLGALDGARVRAPIGAFGIGAFGGLVPDPITGGFASDASRFGVELSWRATRAAWRPEVVVVAHGSNFKGRLDERRVDANASAFFTHGGGTAYLEVSAFDKTNPWNASPIELTAAGADLNARAGPIRVGARGDVRSPERSLWLMAHLPQSWLCVAEAQAPGTPEPCVTEVGRRWLGTADAELGLRWLSWSVGATTTSFGTFATTSQDLEAFTDVRTLGLPHELRVVAGAHAGQGSLVDQQGGYLGAGRSFFKDRVDLSLTWRPTRYAYRALPNDSRMESRLKAAVQIAARSNLDVGFFGDFASGADSSRNFFLFTTTWHAR